MVAFLIILSWTVQAMVWFVDLILRIFLWMCGALVVAVVWSVREITKAIQERQRR